MFGGEAIQSRLARYGSVQVQRKVRLPWTLGWVLVYWRSKRDRRDPLSEIAICTLEEIQLVKDFAAGRATDPGTDRWYGLQNRCTTSALTTGREVGSASGRRVALGESSTVGPLGLQADVIVHPGTKALLADR
jgi:hypothetical protein